MQTTGVIYCPLCHEAVSKLLYRYHIESEREVIEKIKLNNPEWTEQDGICGRCVDYYHISIVKEQRLLPEIGPHFDVRSIDDFIVLPTPLRVGTHPRFTGKGVTICFIDSGFYPHADIVSHKNRIKEMVDINNPLQPKDYFTQPNPESWHGTMTSVVCAGDGYMSNGLYKGIASNAELVLLKVQDAFGRIPASNIVKALQWILQHHERYNIKVVNISVSGDEVVSYKESEIDILTEKLEEAGITVVAAAGNDENGHIKPPANGLHVITVGGVDDENNIEIPVRKLYHSSHGETTDGLLKPELTAHAIWLAAPVLPQTKEHTEASALYQLIDTPAGELINTFEQLSASLQPDGSFSTLNDVTSLYEAVRQRIIDRKYISPHYMHVDGTSFAAPIITAVIAQLLEANPSLTPAMIRQVLFSTARRIDSLPAGRQGFGLVQPRKALISILKKEHIAVSVTTPHINRQKNTVTFYTYHEYAQQMSLAGSFNGWATDVLLMEPGNDGIWKIDIPLLPAGRYSYKFFADGSKWIEDTANPWREPDGFNAFNSLLIIEPDNQPV